jgi:hypothetical protein
MTKVLLIDRSWPKVAELAYKLANLLESDGVGILFLSDKMPSGVKGNIEIINIFDVPQKRSLGDLQSAYTFSLHKTLVTERAYYDYSSFRRSQCYSRLSEDEIAERLTPFANAFDYVIREKADLVLEWFPDCFIPSLSGQISKYYNKPFRMFLQHYWWSDGAFYVDRLDTTSTEVDEKYHHYYAHPELCNREKLDAVFEKKKTLYAFSSSEMYSFSMRLRQVIIRQKSYEPLSIRNWIVRKISKFWSATLIKALIPRYSQAGDEKFVVYPLHIQPEASLLGTYPELADQFGLIKNISMNLPYGVKLYVKEHPYADFGLGLDFEFYRRLSALPNVRIYAGKSSLDALMNHAGFIAVVGLSGTVCLDAAIKRKPAILFGRAIFGAADCFYKPKNFQDFYKQITSIQRGKFEFNEPALYAILNALDSNIIRADVDFGLCRNAGDLFLQFAEIMKVYIKTTRKHCKIEYV